MPSASDRDKARRRHAVRPRKVWGGLLLALAGAATVCVGLVTTTWVTVGLGAAALLAGALLAVAGGALYDAVPVLSAHEEMRDVIADRPRRGTVAGEMHAHSQDRSRAAETGVRTQELLSASRRTHAPSPTPAAGWTLLLVTFAAVNAQWDWIARTSTGRESSVRDTALAIILSLCGIRLGIARGRHTVTATLALLAGGSFVLAAFLASHGGAAAVAVELVCGALGIAAGAVAWLRPWVPEEGAAEPGS